jgi:phytoene dehydrogenase-like protein
MASLLAAHYKERAWMRRKKVEEIVYRIEALNLVIYDFFQGVYNVEIGVAHLNDRRTYARIESKLVELKLQIKIYFPSTAAKFAKVVSTMAAAYQSLEALAQSNDLQAQARLEALDFAVSDLLEALDNVQRDFTGRSLDSDLFGPMRGLWKRDSGAASGRSAKVV